MTSSIGSTFDETFESGELYLFHKSDSRCPSEESLWGVFDRLDHGRILLESGTLDFEKFELWYPLPPEYLFCRLASRNELRDYTYNIAAYEFQRRHSDLLKDCDLLPFPQRHSPLKKAILQE